MKQLGEQQTNNDERGRRKKKSKKNYLWYLLKQVFSCQHISLCVYLVSIFFFSYLYFGIQLNTFDSFVHGFCRNRDVWFFRGVFFCCGAFHCKQNRLNLSFVFFFVFFFSFWTTYAFEHFISSSKSTVMSTQSFVVFFTFSPFLWKRPT